MIETLHNFSASLDKWTSDAKDEEAVHRSALSTAAKSDVLHLAIIGGVPAVEAFVQLFWDVNNA